MQGGEDDGHPGLSGPHPASPGSLRDTHICGVQVHSWVPDSSLQSASSWMLRVRSHCPLFPQTGQGGSTAHLHGWPLEGVDKDVGQRAWVRGRAGSPSIASNPSLLLQ